MSKDKNLPITVGNYEYIAPCDMFNGKVKKGTIYVALDSAGSEFEPKGKENSSIAICRVSGEIVKKWEKSK
jgi:hypothetical protein